MTDNNYSYPNSNNTTTENNNNEQAQPPQPPQQQQQQQQQQQSIDNTFENEFWQETMTEMQHSNHFKLHQLPLARIKKVMKSDQDVKMISAEAPILFSKGCDIFIKELTLLAWKHAVENKRRTLQRSDIAAALSKSDMFDFLIDIVPRVAAEEEPTVKNEKSAYSSAQQVQQVQQVQQAQQAQQQPHQQYPSYANYGYALPTQYMMNDPALIQQNQMYMQQEQQQQQMYNNRLDQLSSSNNNTN